ncbi:MAG: dicarboxylate/amino acid:cation symporter [Lachnospiraceae bacterium]|nr:dicarboxylate/amino acid:cation symporter [Lachnospiraceae bacterium]
MNEKKKFNVTFWIVIGLAAGIIVGLIMPAWLYTPLSVVATIYMSALKMMIYPLVFCSLVIGIVGIGNIAKTGKIGLHAFLWYTGTTAFASGLGLILPKLLHLGENASITATATEVEAATFGGLLDTLTSIIPSNPVTSFAEGNMLQVLAFAVIIGLACLSLKEKAQPVADLCQAINDISILVVSKVMLCTPVGVFCCIATVMFTNGTTTMIQLAQVMIALYVCYALYAILVYGGMVKVFGKCSPAKFFKNVAPAALNAFGTCSSSATIPISMRCATEELEVPEEIASLTLPLGATINMDAVSILMSFMITFFASACGVPMTTGTMLTILACNVLLSIGTPGVPGGAIAAFAALAPIAGLPVNTILGVYISVNTLADMGATCVNVLGDLACTAVLKQTLRKVTGK